MKPQIAADVMPSVAALTGAQTLVLSVMAGKTLDFLEAALPGAAIARAMPNTPAAIGRGITVLVPNAKVTPAQRAIATDLISATGKVEWIDDERLMDAVTAVSGSGPAYVFLLAEALAKPASLPVCRKSLPKSWRVKPSRAPASCCIARRSILRHYVKMSHRPAGTTAAALEILMGPGGFDALMKQAVAAAAKRSKELAG